MAGSRGRRRATTECAPCSFRSPSVTSSTAPRPSTRDRVAVVDEPDQPAAPWPDLTYAELAHRAARQAATLDRLGVPVGARVAIVSHNSARLLTSFFGVSRLGPGARAGQLPARAAGGRVTSSSTPAPRCCSSTRRCGRCSTPSSASGRSCSARTTTRSGRRRRSGAVGGRRGRDRDDQLHVRHDGAPQGRAADPPQPLAERRRLRLARRRQRPRRLPAHAADVPRQRLGHPFTATGMGVRHVVLRQIDGAEILRRIERARRHVPVRRPGRRRRRPRRRRGLGRRDPRPRPGAHHRRRRAAADADDRAGARGARLGVHPDLRPHRDRAAAHDEPDARGVGRPRAHGAGAAARARPARPRSASGWRSTTTGEVLAQSNHNLEAYWENPEATAEAQAGGWFHTGDGGSVDDGYLTIADRKKDVIISGGENVSSIEVEDALMSAPRGARGRRHRHPGREVGRAGDRARRRSTSAVTRRGPDRALPASTSPATSARSGSSSATSWRAPPPASCRSSSCASRSGRATTAR